MSSCEICDGISRLFGESAAKEQSVNLGSFEHAVASQCTDHVQIIKDFRKHCSDSGVAFFAPEDSKDVGFVKSRNGDSITLYESTKNLRHFWELTIARREEPANHPGVGRILDPDWIDLDIAKKWKRECLSSHGVQCQNPLKIPPATPAWLIDVEKKCMVPGGDAKQYVALSYRSSSDTVHRTTPAELQEAGVLERPEILEHVPLKIQHAMSLVATMDERYLWADFLCFDFSDTATIHEQLSMMTSIYADAIVTIIAADGDRVDGINGIEDVSKSRSLDQKVFAFRNEHLVVRKTGIFSLENWHEYHKRGWTYQEFKMSPRKLLFMNKQIHWQCRCSVWHEEITLEGKVATYIDPRPLVISAGFPDLGSLGHMLSNYNERELTYDEDALAAISGLLTLFSRSFTGGFLYGLPEMFFDNALAWKPYWAHSTMRERKASGEPSDIQFTASDLPSWSWVGWQGIFGGWGRDAMRINDRAYCIEEVSPITEWYTSSASKGQPLRRIRSTWFEDRDERKDISNPLPDGWSRLPASETGDFRQEPRLYPKGCGQYIYYHEAMPDKDCETWYYPFTVPKIDLSTPYYMPEQTRYLFCKTWRSSVWSRRRYGDHGVDPKEDHVLILCRSADGARIGTLQLQTDEQLALWPSPEPQQAVEMNNASSGWGRMIEIVAINQCVLSSKTFNEELQRYDYPITQEERITVLWVEWKDGVAYRLACGYVVKEAWEGLALETVDLVLG